MSVLGSTGSIGCSTLDLIERNPGQYSVEALTGFGNVEKLAGQARRFRPRLAVTGDPNCYQALKDALADTDVEVAAGTPAIIEAASRPADWVMSALVGAAGLEPTLAAVRRGAVVALANKECLVCAGAVLLQDAKRHGATILPVDSEHSAIFQVWDFEHPEAVARIILTASGGPFRRLSSAEMAKATPSQAVAHPNWSMGAKISVDSATMMNKGLELIEAHHLFGLPEERIEILVHPQSVVHSLVAYIDGSVLAQLGTPDMRTPIAYALAWPGRMAAPSPPLDLAAIGTLSFEAPDADRFPALRLAREALRQGGAAPTVLNAANEIAVRGFLNGTIGFSRIAAVVEATLEKVPACDALTLPELLAVDATARYIANELLTL